MTEELIGYACHHGLCPSEFVHKWRDYREFIVRRASRAMNWRGINFQPDQTWSVARKRRARKAA